MWRRQPAVASPISIAAVGRAFAKTIVGSPTAADRASSLVASCFGTPNVILTDSGTSALVLALRSLVPRGGIVGFPGYACVDLAAAALFAGVRVRLYDLDPQSLSPDLDSVSSMLRRGVDAVVVAHLFGYPADVPGVKALASAAGVAVIEDAAQAAGGRLHGRRLGTLGDVAVLSFGRGKGLCAGGGGALLGFDAQTIQSLQPPRDTASKRGLIGLAGVGVQWALGRPSLFAIPSMIPWLHLGEMVYHPAHEPECLSIASSALLPSALELEADDVRERRRRSQVLDSVIAAAPNLGSTQPIAGAEPGYLRYPVRDLGGGRTSNPQRGVLRPYPKTLMEQEELAPILLPLEPSVVGATELRRTLFTLPTHRYVASSDLEAMKTWLTGASLNSSD